MSGYKGKDNSSAIVLNLASLTRGLYGRVARKLKVDPSYVSRVARGERQSSQIETCLQSELRRIKVLMGKNTNGAGRKRSATNHR